MRDISYGAWPGNLINESIPVLMRKQPVLIEDYADTSPGPLLRQEMTVQPDSSDLQSRTMSRL